MVADRRTRHPQDERDAAACQHRAGGPHERLRLAEGDDYLQNEASENRRQDLRHTDMEAETYLAECVERDDDPCHMQSRVAKFRQYQWVGSAPDANLSRGGQRRHGHTRGKDVSHASKG